MKTILAAICCVALGAVYLLGPPVVQAQQEGNAATWWVVGSGGTVATSQGGDFSATVSQTVIGTTEESGNTARLGFWVPQNAPLVKAVHQGVATPSQNALALRNYPNPFRSVTTFGYELPERVHVRLRIFTMMGDLVRTLVDDIQQKGEHSITWDGSSDDGSVTASDSYIYVLETDNDGTTVTGPQRSARGIIYRVK
jgi:hypothetical protein